MSLTRPSVEAKLSSWSAVWRWAPRFSCWSSSLAAHRHWRPGRGMEVQRHHRPRDLDLDRRTRSAGRRLVRRTSPDCAATSRRTSKRAASIPTKAIFRTPVTTFSFAPSVRSNCAFPISIVSAKGRRSVVSRPASVRISQTSRRSVGRQWTQRPSASHRGHAPQIQGEARIKI